jgi:hypothetical protein
MCREQWEVDVEWVGFLVTGSWLICLPAPVLGLCITLNFLVKSSNGKILTVPRAVGGGCWVGWLYCDRQLACYLPLFWDSIYCTVMLCLSQVFLWYIPTVQRTVGGWCGVGWTYSDRQLADCSTCLCTGTWHNVKLESSLQAT